MLFAKRISFLFLLSSIAVATASASYRLVLQTGHEGAPVAMEWHDRSSTIVSAGEDGRIIVTDPEDGKVLHRFRVTSDRIVDLKTDPGNNRVAIVSTNEEGSEIAVWDWDDEEKVYGFRLESEPLFLSWSANGRYIIAGNLGTPSVLVLEGRTGRRLSYLQRLPSLYNAGYIGSTETILMTYATSGAIRYWDIRSAALKGSSETVGNLVGVTVLQIADSDNKKTMMFGYRNESLYLINRNTGAVMDQMDVPGLSAVSADPETGEIDVLTHGPAGIGMQRFKVDSGVFETRDFDAGPLSSTASSDIFGAGMRPARILRKEGRTYFISERGNLFTDGPSGFMPVIEDRVWRPDSLAFSGESMFLAGGSRILRFVSPFFSEDSRGDMEDLNTLGKDGSPTGTTSDQTGLEILADGRLVAWAKDTGGSSGSGYRIFRYPVPSSGSYVKTGAALQEVDVIDDERLLTVDRSGTVSIVDGSTGTPYTTFSALGILDAAYSADNNSILIGKSSGRTGTPLETVDAETRESIPVDDDRFMVYAVEAGPKALYSIGVESGGRGSSTVLLRHDPGHPERTRVVLDEDGEDLDALLVPHPFEEGVFTTMGNRVRRVGGGRSAEYAWQEPITALAYRGTVLYGLDRDGAMVIWDKDGGDALLEVHFFEDGSWIALAPGSDMVWASSPEAVENVMLYRNGRPADPRRISRLIETTPAASIEG